ncbi:DUF3137 domain-containing protein [Mycobacterium sp. D16R24]|uniref:DUF3137 domain-containing protein n=1 Tax=Mycobacterium sp. D16R24 TaxID=1855656 RepID=UPI00099468AD|nr:DUF3137 domain-containing protein [Mycobacterium sp. D16R24]
MSTLFGLLSLGTVAAIVGGLAVLGIWLFQTARRNHRRRLARLWAFASSRGWSSAESEPGLVGLSACAPFGVGHSRSATDVIRGAIEGVPFVSFTYTYRTGNSSDNTETTHTAMVSCIRTPPSPSMLLVTSEGALGGLMDAIGLGDLKLESEDFNRRFHIRTNNDRFAYDVLNPSTMHRMLTDRRFQLPMRFDNSNLFTWRWEALRPEWVEPHVRYLIDLLRGVPEYAWDRR